MLIWRKAEGTVLAQSLALNLGHGLGSVSFPSGGEGKRMAAVVFVGSFHISWWYLGDKSWNTKLEGFFLERTGVFWGFLTLGGRGGYGALMDFFVIDLVWKVYVGSRCGLYMYRDVANYPYRRQPQHLCKLFQWISFWEVAQQQLFRVSIRECSMFVLACP